MEGTEPSTTPAPASTPRHRRRWLLTVLVVAVAIVVASISVYLATRPPPIPLTVSGGSTMGMIVWNESTGSNQTELVLNFAATTYANKTDGAVSTLTLRLHTWVFYDSGGGTLSLNINATVSGAFASGLRPTDLRLVANLTGLNSSLQSFGSYQYGTNVSFPGQSFGIFNGTGTLSATISSERFSYSDYFRVDGRPGHNRFVGFRATVSGDFSPAVSVGILLHVVYQPA